MVALLATAISLLACISTGVYAVPPPPLVDVPIVVQNQTEREVNKRVPLTYMYVRNDGGISLTRPPGHSIQVAKTTSVSYLAQLKASRIVSRMVQNMLGMFFNPLSRSLGVGLFARNEGVFVYPEYSGLVDRPECHNRCNGTCSNTCTHDGRKFSQIFGLTGNRSVVLDDNVLCDSHDPFRSSSNILSHEFAHLIMNYMPVYWRNKINIAYNEAKAAQLWDPASYAMSSDWEYWALATESFFFDTLRTNVTGGMNMCGTQTRCQNEMAARNYLRQHDPKVFEVLSLVYTNNRPTLPGNVHVCQ